MNDIEKHIAISCLPKLNTDQRLKLASLPVDIDQLLSLDAEILKTVLDMKDITSLKRKAAPRWYEDFLSWYEKPDNKVTCYGEPAYPKSLLDIQNPPFLLCHKGPLTFREPSLSIVGTRNASERALIAAFSLGLECADSGTPVISGFARGIDKASHEGCIAADGNTMAVLGGGLGNLPIRDELLIDRILENGGSCVSEFHPSSAPLAWRFPLRNRIISALSPVTIVIQAPCGSGALLTADLALRQGRDVMVHEAGIMGSGSAGTKKLSEDGALVVRGLSDIAKHASVEYKASRTVIVSSRNDNGWYPFRLGCHTFGFADFP